MFELGAIKNTVKSAVKKLNVFRPHFSVLNVHLLE